MAKKFLALLALLALVPRSGFAQTDQQVSVQSPVIGEYTSDAFFPKPLMLIITGVDGAGNVSGSISGMGLYGTFPKHWERWHYIFGPTSFRAKHIRDAVGPYRSGGVQATLRGGILTILGAPGNIVYYRLNKVPGGFDGQYTAPPPHQGWDRPIRFRVHGQG